MRGLAILLILFTELLMSQTPGVQLTVLDLESREPLVGAYVLLDEELAGATDPNGQLMLAIGTGDHVINVSYIGYEDYEREFSFNDLEGPLLEALLKPSKTLLQTATVTGSKYEKPLAESVVSIDVLRPDLITRTSAPDVEEVLNRMPGVQMLDGQANIRGGSGWSYGAGSRVLLLLDDIPILQVDAAIPNWDDVPLENIGQVEILKGASSALYGSSALNGIINIKTDYAKSEPETILSLQGSNFFMPDDSTDYDFRYASLINLMHRRKIGKLDLVAGGAYVNDMDARIGDELEYFRSNVNLRYRVQDDLVVGLNSVVNSGSSRSYFFWDAYNSFRGDPGGYTNTDRTRFNIDPFVRYNNGRWTHKLLGRVYRTNNQSDNNQSNASWMTYGEYQAQYADIVSGLNVAGGLVYTNTQVEAELYSDTVFVNRNIAGYAQIDKKFFDKLSLSAGMRYEYNRLNSPELIAGDTIPGGKIEESRPVFRFGLNYQLLPVTYLRASYGQGYRFPSIAEKFINTEAGGIQVRPNVDLNSEHGWSSEIGLRQGYGGNGWNGYADLAFFWSEYDDMMEFSAAKNANDELFFHSQNVGGVRISGVEISTYSSFRIMNMDASFLAGYTYIDPIFLDYDETGNGGNIVDPRFSLGQLNAAKSTSDENVLKYRSRHNMKMDLQLQQGRWFGGLGFIYVSEMEAFDRVLLIQVPGLLAPQDDDRDGYKTFDLRLGYNWTPLKVQVQLKNVFNEIYSARPGYLEPPRHLTVRLEYRI